MTKIQLEAISNPCRLAFETAQPRFAHLIRGGKASLIVTVNSGWE